MTCGKKSTKKSPAYRRGFKPNFSVSPLLFRIGFFTPDMRRAIALPLFPSWEELGVLSLFPYHEGVLGVIYIWQMAQKGITFL
jgi:hypothetical protein